MRPRVATALEDKILQRALVEVLNAIYEADFLGFSYGFRPGRSPHHALDALSVGIVRRKVNWVLDLDFREFFTSLDHRWLEKFLEHRIADRRVLRLIQKWMAAGVIEDGAWTASEEGVPQGASASCATTKNGRFKLKRTTDTKRMRAKLSKVKAELIRRRDLPIPDQGRWLASVLRGHFNYYAVPDNGKAITTFRYHVTHLWLRALRRRSQRHRMTWRRIGLLADRWLPPARIVHPWPTVRFDAITQGRSPVR